MRIPLQAARRRAVAGWFALAGLFLVAVEAPAQTATPIEKRLPDSTLAFVAVKDAAALRAALDQSQFGRLWNDPALKVYRDELGAAIDAAGKDLKETLGVNVPEFFALFQGPGALALLPCKDSAAALPFTAVAIVDAGKNAAAMHEVLTRFTRESERHGPRPTTETFRDVTIHVLPLDDDDPAANKETPRKKPQENDEDEEDEEANVPVPPIVWAQQGSIFYVGTGLEAVKDLVAHAEGRDDALAASESYTESVRKLGSDAPVFWFIEMRKLGALLLKEMSVEGFSGNLVDAQSLRKSLELFRLTGLGGLKAVAGNVALGAGNCDSIAKTTFLYQGPAQGLLKVFSLPPVALQPEPWVPASVATYQSISWDLDHAFAALSELANLVAPGLLELLQKELADPEGGEPFLLKQDLFDPLGDRITIIGDFKKPIRGDSVPMRVTVTLDDPEAPRISFREGNDSRALLAVALEDSQRFQNTLNKLIALTGLKPQKREFQGTIIHDFEIPEVPLPDSRLGPRGKGTNAVLKGPISVAIARDTLFISREPTLLEQVLRGGGPTLAASDAYRAFAREMPDHASSVFYVRPEEQARLTYALVKKAQLETALQGAAFSVVAELPALAASGERNAFPEFSVFTRYAAPAGRYSESSDDGLTITSFVLRQTKP
jgi:hypothetical protein